MKYLAFILSTFILTVPLNCFLYHQWKLMNWVNSCFWESIILLMIGGLLCVLKGEFFHAFVYACKKFFILSNKKEQLIAELEHSEQTIYERQKRIYPSYTAWIISGVTLFVFSLILSIASQ